MEHEWLVSTQPYMLLRALQNTPRSLGSLDERKLRLLLVAAIRTLFQPPKIAIFENELLARIEDMADGKGAGVERKVLTSRLNAMAAAGCAFSEADLLSWAASDYLIEDSMYLDGEWARQVGAEVYAGLIREIFRNPFNHSRRTSWAAGKYARDVITQDALHVASMIYDTRGFHELPVLADALEDGGVTNQEVLTHLRSPGPHVLGCWALDLVLGKE